MAGDWIPIRTDIPNHPKTLRIAQQLRKTPDEVVGLLVRFWSWVQQHTDSGRLEGMSIELCALGAGVPSKFLESLVSVDWLVVADPDLLIPEFPRWFSGAAKRRLRDAARKRAIRGNNGRPQSVRNLSAHCPQNVRSDADKMRTTGQDRKGYLKTPPLNSPPAARGGFLDWGKVVFPSGVEDSPPLREAIERWLEYRQKIRKRYRDPEYQVSLLLKRLGTRLPEAVEHSIAMGYQGCFLPPSQASQGPDFESLFVIPDREPGEDADAL